jgi:predicted nucleic acid-binding protein
MVGVCRPPFPAPAGGQGEKREPKNVTMEDIMRQAPRRVYVDNSVISGMFDDHMPERVKQTGLFWQTVIDGEIRIIASDVLKREVADAPLHVRNFFNDLPESQIEQIESTDESDDLAAQYIGAEVITDNHMDDCKHVALATIAQADAVVSWNCDDMVNPNRIPKYNEVNITHGYQKIEILTPNDFMETHHDNT